MPKCDRNGITLTEVVIGIALLGSLLTLIIVGSGRLASTKKIAELKVHAIEHLDRLLGEWSISGYPEAGESGTVDGRSALRWHVDHRDCSMGARPVVIVRVSISTIAMSGQRLANAPRSDSQMDDLLLASVEILATKNMIGKRRP
ncbi:MAG: hypothetical protein MUC83_00405 [Pirellula sp.]|jgi:hypothetical protein|nr:hypothetical protein [Pirellula sp.]